VACQIDGISSPVQLGPAMLGAMLSKSLLLVMGLALIAPAARAHSTFVSPPVLLTPPPGAVPSPCQDQAFAQEAEVLTIYLDARIIYNYVRYIIFIIVLI